ncbi:MAG: flagellar motor stator protein MotA [Deltaproteobacteria bacterium]|jgi:chemotaxis protein MotA|nr:flagellar motor stator protein MotA [Deltaproteobacteria bacterium]
MLTIVGYIIVLGSVATGFVLSGGNLLMIIQPNEFIIIFGAASGAFIASCTNNAFRTALKQLPQVLFPRNINKVTYMQTLSVLFALFSKMHREGIISIEKDIEDPKSSSIFSSSPTMSKDLLACYFIGDTLRTFLTTGKADELGELMDTDVESISEEMEIGPANIEKMAESLPGMGIVAAVLGVVLTMSYISEPPEVLGHHIGAALLGTFLGILLCYGIFGPIALKLSNIRAERITYFRCIRSAVMAAVHGLSPMIALEYGRRSIPPAFRPTFTEMESTLKG